MKQNVPRGFRNHNPLNIRYNPRNDWKGRVKKKQDDAFEEFENDEYGFRAAMRLIQVYVTRYRCGTLASIIKRFAPPCENETDEYIKFVQKFMYDRLLYKIDPYNERWMTSIVLAMCIMENGYSYVDAHRLEIKSAIYSAFEMYIADYPKLT